MKWKEPQELSTLDVGFGPKDGIKNYIPPYTDIPEEFKRIDICGKNKWLKFVNDAFFKGMKDVRCVVKNQNIDQAKAMRHLQMLLGSFDLSHEHKEAGVAYLASLWFDDITYTVGK